MSIFKKINNRLQDSSNWILNTPESLVILMLMGTGIGGLAFGSFSIAMGFSKHWFFMILFGVFSFSSSKKFIDIFKMVRKLGLKNALGGFTSANFVWHRDKNFKKIDGGVEDGNNRTKQTDEVCDEQNEGSDGIGKKGNGADNSEPERTNAWSRIMLERSGSNVDKDGVSKR